MYRDAKLTFLYVVLIAILLLISPLHSQISFDRVYGGTGREYGYSVLQTADGGYVIAGVTYSFGSGGGDVWLLKTNAEGDTLWTKTYGGLENDGGRSVDITSDGGYIITGYTGSSGILFYAVYLIKTNAYGDTSWTSCFGDGWNNFGWSVRQTSDGGYIITGSTDYYQAGNDDVYVIKTDSLGAAEWTSIMGGSGDDCGKSVIELPNNRYLLVGNTQSFGPGGNAVWLIMLNSDGDTLWTHLYGGDNADTGNEVKVTTDNRFIIAGETNSFGAGAMDCYIVLTDSFGDTIWTRTMGGTNWDFGESIEPLSNGCYILAGATRSFGAGNYDVWLIKTDTMGNTMWSQTYGGTSYDYGRSVQHTADGGFVIVGETWSFGSGQCDLYLLKTDSLGAVGVSDGQVLDLVTPDLPIKCAPNPFIHYTDISFSTVYQGTDMGLMVYSATGRLVKQLLPIHGHGPIPDSYRWNGIDDNGTRLPAGVYFVRLEMTDYTATKKVILLD